MRERSAIVPATSAAKLFMCAASRSETRLAAIPAMPALTLTPAAGRSARLATIPPGVTRPNAWAAIGAPAAQAANVMTSDAANLPRTRPAAKRPQKKSPSITANDRAQPVSKSFIGSLPYTARNVADHATSESGLRQKSGAAKYRLAIDAALTALGLAPVIAT